MTVRGSSNGAFMRNNIPYMTILAQYYITLDLIEL